MLYRVSTGPTPSCSPELDALAAPPRRASCTCWPDGREPGRRRRPFEPATCRALVPDIAERDVYVCGPPAMTAAVFAACARWGCPAGQVHAERFSLA